MTPEKIPDSTAYRLIFHAFSEPANPTAEQVARQRAKIAPIRLTDAEANIFSVVLSRFHQTYNDFLERYKQAAADSSNFGVPLNQGQFLSERESIVASTRAGLQSQLSAATIKRIDDFVQSEKRRMTAGPANGSHQMAGH